MKGCMRLLKILLICVAYLIAYNNAYAGYTAHEAGRALRDLLTSNYLILEYKESSCIRYINPTGLDVLIKSNNKEIKNIENSLSQADYSVFKVLASSDEQKQLLKRLSKTYITDEINSYKKEAGGMPFACGIAFGNVMHLQVKTMSGSKQ